MLINRLVMVHMGLQHTQCGQKNGPTITLKGYVRGLVVCLTYTLHYFPHFGSQLKQLLQQKPAIHGLTLVSHFPHSFCCTQLYVPGAGGTSVQPGVGGGGGGGEGAGGGVAFPHFGSQPKQLLQQKPAIHGFAFVSHFPHSFCFAQLYVPGAGGSSEHPGVGGGGGGTGGGFVQPLHA